MMNNEQYNNIISELAAMDEKLETLLACVAEGDHVVIGPRDSGKRESEKKMTKMLTESSDDTVLLNLINACDNGADFLESPCMKCNDHFVCLKEVLTANCDCSASLDELYALDRRLTRLLDAVPDTHPFHSQLLRKHDLVKTAIRDTEITPEYEPAF